MLKKISLCFVAIGTLLFLCGCLQTHSDERMWAIPVTNSPDLIPGSGASSPGAAF